MRSLPDIHMNIRLSLVNEMVITSDSGSLIAEWENGSTTSVSSGGRNVVVSMKNVNNSWSHPTSASCRYKYWCVPFFVP